MVLIMMRNPLFNYHQFHPSSVHIYTLTHIYIYTCIHHLDIDRWRSYLRCIPNLCICIYRCSTQQPEEAPLCAMQYLTLDVTGMDSVSNPARSTGPTATPTSPETEVSSIVTSFPKAMRFKRKPPPRKQSFNKYGNPFTKDGRRSNSFQRRQSILQGTNWDTL